ncbi:MAG: hypothetical protein AAFX87_31870 [Bacteroidota bacterium]
MQLRNFLLLVLAVCLVSCQQTRITGTWRVTDINRDNYIPLTALPEYDLDNERRSYDSALLQSEGSLFYLALEEEAKIEFLNTGAFNTTLFLSNFGEKTFSYDPESSELVLRLSHEEESFNFPHDQELYKGHWKFINPSTATWELNNGKILTLSKE